MSIMDRMDKLMLISARITLGIVFLQNIVPVFIGWIDPFWDHHGFPRIGSPLLSIILWMVCLWNLQRRVCRLILAFSAGILILISVLADFLVIKNFGTVSAAIRDNAYLIFLMESFIFLGLLSIFWVSFRPPQNSKHSSLNSINDLPLPQSS